MSGGRRIGNELYRRFIKGRSRYARARRYEFVRNSLFCGALLACLFSAVITAFDASHVGDNTVGTIFIYTIILVLLWWLSRAGRHTISAGALLICSSIALSNVIHVRHHALPRAELALAYGLLVTGMFLEVHLTRVALAAERDLLERRVIERTTELEEIQLRRTLELQRFAEFGRLSAQLLHEVSNPLTVASLHLEQANNKSSQAIRQARRSLQQLERYVMAARRQLQHESSVTNFDMQEELSQVLRILRPVAQQAGVKLIVDIPQPIQLHGDPVRFNQIISNLVTNAIQAYQGYERTTQRTITLRCIRQSRYAQCTVHDNAAGISPLHLQQIFEPFYTTKHATGRSLGIGLSIVRRTVREHFHGTICANSTVGIGTTFTLLLRIEPLLLETLREERTSSGTLLVGASAAP